MCSPSPQCGSVAYSVLVKINFKKENVMHTNNDSTIQTDSVLNTPINFEVNQRFKLIRTGSINLIWINRLIKSTQSNEHF